ncbi:hypothetical protein R9C00_13830 [Flammeovirgaceae bacterium SG7u.111]|nr:hypothetical protein [Flammeovirgaceae bacterium SG7u.132]WPO38535.1 hypothetical protein R9C00_13830 [Flammeovirgaceae bacterium SG7u.111]
MPTSAGINTTYNSKKKSPFKKKRNSGKKSFFKRLTPSYSVFAHYASIHSEAVLQLEGDNALLNNESVGSFSSSFDRNVYNNSVQVADYSTRWSSYDAPEEYNYQEAAPKRDLVMGFVTELRDVDEYAYKGYFITLGLMYMKTPFPELPEVSQFQIHMPIGAGVIIPGDFRFHAEVGASALLSTRGVTGGKFDFLFVVKNMKFGPVFTFSHSTYNNVKTQFGAAGLQVGIIPNQKKSKTHKRRRR